MNLIAMIFINFVLLPLAVLVCTPFIMVIAIGGETSYWINVKNYYKKIKTYFSKLNKYSDMILP